MPDREGGDEVGEAEQMRMQIRMEEGEKGKFVDRVARGDHARSTEVLEALSEEIVPTVEGSEEVAREDRARTSNRRVSAAGGIH